jgi:hypothetical protein
VVAGFFGHLLTAFDNNGNPLPGWITNENQMTYCPPVLVDLDGDGYDEIISLHHFSDQFYAFDSNGASMPGWPVPGSGDTKPYTPAVGDIDGDGKLEIVTGTYLINPDQPEVRPALSSNTSAYPVIGDVDGDGALEAVIIDYYCCGKKKIKIYSGTGVLERSFNTFGDSNEGVPPALADLNGDHTPEIIFFSQSHLEVYYGNGTSYPGWPQYVGQDYWQAYTTPVVGDVDGDKQPDIVVTLYRYSNYTGEVRVYNRNGVLHPRFPKYIDVGIQGGATPAIADIDLDGRNEIVITGQPWHARNEFLDNLWVLDLGGPAHGKIEWGQFGGGPHHRGIYPVPGAPSPKGLPSTGILNFLPLVSGIGTPVAPAPTGIHGRILLNGIPKAGIPMDLLKLNGGQWITQKTVSTNANGNYAFTGVPSLSSNQVYLVRYQNKSGAGDRLTQWISRQITRYVAGNTVGISDIDIANVSLAGPVNGTRSALPITFEWTERPNSHTDMYSLVLYDATDGSPAYQSQPWGDNSGFILYHLPPGFSNGSPYAWSVWIRSPDGELGVARWPRMITILASLTEVTKSEPQPMAELLWSDNPALPCWMFDFLPTCER